MPILTENCNVTGQFTSSFNNVDIENGTPYYQFPQNCGSPCYPGSGTTQHNTTQHYTTRNNNTTTQSIPAPTKINNSFYLQRIYNIFIARMVSITQIHPRQYNRRQVLLLLLLFLHFCFVALFSENSFPRTRLCLDRDTRGGSKMSITSEEGPLTTVKQLENAL